MLPDAAPTGAQFLPGFDAPAARASLFFALLPDAWSAGPGERLRAEHRLRSVRGQGNHVRAATWPLPAPTAAGSA